MPPELELESHKLFDIDSDTSLDSGLRRNDDLGTCTGSYMERTIAVSAYIRMKILSWSTGTTIALVFPAKAGIQKAPRD